MLGLLKLFTAINFCSYLIGSFQNFLEQILTYGFLRYWSWFEAFHYLHIRVVGGGSLQVEYLHIGVAGGSAFESNVFIHYSRAAWRALGPPKRIQMGPFNISKHLGSCVFFRASYKLAPWAVTATQIILKSPDLQKHPERYGKPRSGAKPPRFCTTGQTILKVSKR